MKRVDGWACPALLSGPGNYMRRGIETVQGLMPLVRGRKVVVQAGGHVGTVPVLLSERFDTVFTFEPEPENFAALAANAWERGKGRIVAAQAALGDVRGPVGLKVSARSTGQHMVASDAPGRVLVHPLDDLALPVVDALLLDVEGFEIPAIRGARQTIKRCRPVVIAEENKRAVQQGFRIGELDQVMFSMGYALKATIGEDRVYVPKS